MLKPAWTLLIFARVGVPYLVILDTYDAVVQRDGSLLVGGPEEKGRDHVLAKVELLRFWVSSAQTSATDSAARSELARAVVSGRLLPKIDDIKSWLETSRDTGYVLETIREIEHGIQSSI